MSLGEGRGEVTEQTQKSLGLWGPGDGVLKIQIFIVMCKISSMSACAWHALIEDLHMSTHVLYGSPCKHFYFTLGDVKKNKTRMISI